MKTFLTVLTTRQSKQKASQSLFWFFIILFFIACSSPEKKNDGVAIAVTPVAGTPVVDSFLDVLYLTNFPDSPQLEKLIRKPPYKKVVFTFALVSGKLTLTGWPSVRGNQGNPGRRGYVLADTVNLNILRPSETRISPDSTYYLGDQDLNDSTHRPWSGLNMLVNDSSARYIIFVPVIRDRHIVYKVGKAHTIDDSFIKKKDFFTAFTEITELNPSPPHGAF